jgi:hypothetical protein
MEVFPMMRAKDSGLVFKNAHDAMREDVGSHVSIDGGQRIVKKIKFFVLDKDKIVGNYKLILFILDNPTSSRGCPNVGVQAPGGVKHTPPPPPRSPAPP